jgi:hypothetical protein
VALQVERSQPRPLDERWVPSGRLPLPATHLALPFLSHRSVPQSCLTPRLRPAPSSPMALALAPVGLDNSCLVRQWYPQPGGKTPWPG